MTLSEAAAQGIARLRLPHWANPVSHIKIDIFAGGSYGPWVHFYDPMNEELNGRNPVDMIVTEMGDEDRWEPYHDS